MIKRRTIEKQVANDRWLVSYSDFITLLFAFFVVMYSVSQVNEEKYRSLAETLNSAFTNEAPNTTQREEPSQNIASLSDVAGDIEQQLTGFPVEGSLTMSANENWLELTLNSELLFGSGSAIPSKDAQDLFSALVDTLSDYENEIQVHGHTDNIPISNAEFANNWALSSARAVAIVNFFAYQGVASERLSAVAFGEYRPIASNATEEGRQNNRRVVIRIASQASAAQKANMDEVMPVLDTEGNETENVLTVPNASVERSSNSADQPQNSGIKPVRLRGGDLLFTSDPDLPRLRALEPGDNQ